MSSFHTILVPHDFSDTAERAFRTASELAAECGADLHLLHVMQPLPYAFAGEAHAGLHDVAGAESSSAIAATSVERLESVSRSACLPSDRIRVHVFESSGVPQTIVSAAESLGADLIAMGTHGRTGLAHVLMGSVTEATMRNASCPVLAVPPASRHASRVERWEASRHPPLGAL